MKRTYWNIVILISATTICRAQSDSVGIRNPVQTPVYRFNLPWEIPATVLSGGITLYNFARISNKSDPTEAQLAALNKNNVNALDRWSFHPYSKNIDQISYIPFYIAIPLPLLCLLDKKMRHDFLKISFLYVEALAATGVIYSSAVNFTNRFRPFTYYADAPANLAMESNAKKSFFGGHVAVVATSFFFMARVYSAYHPGSPLKWVFYSTAGVVTAATACLRNYAGMHFLTDVLVGAAVGTVSGLIVPGLHRIKNGKPSRLTIIPVGGNGLGLSAFYRI